MSTFAAPLVPDLFRIDADGTVTLLGGRSASSGRTHFPRRPVCPFTAVADVEPVDLPRTGTLWGSTVVRVAPPGYPGEVPYALGIVELTDGLRVLGRLAVDPAAVPSIGAAMEVTALEVGDAEGSAASIWAFAPTVEDPG